MFTPRRPLPSPGPEWTAIKENRASTNFSDDDDEQELTPLRHSRHIHGPSSSLSLKRRRVSPPLNSVERPNSLLPIAPPRPPRPTQNGQPESKKLPESPLRSVEQTTLPVSRPRASAESSGTGPTLPESPRVVIGRPITSTGSHPNPYSSSTIGSNSEPDSGALAATGNQKLFIPSHASRRPYTNGDTNRISDSSLPRAPVSRYLVPRVSRPSQLSSLSSTQLPKNSAPPAAERPSLPRSRPPGTFLTKSNAFSDPFGGPSRTPAITSASSTRPRHPPTDPDAAPLDHLNKVTSSKSSAEAVASGSQIKSSKRPKSISDASDSSELPDPFDLINRHRKPNAATSGMSDKGKGRELNLKKESPFKTSSTGSSARQSFSHTSNRRRFQDRSSNSGGKASRSPNMGARPTKRRKTEPVVITISSEDEIQIIEKPALKRQPGSSRFMAQMRRKVAERYSTGTAIQINSILALFANRNQAIDVDAATGSDPPKNHEVIIISDDDNIVHTPIIDESSGTKEHPPEHPTIGSMTSQFDQVVINDPGESTQDVKMSMDSRASPHRQDSDPNPPRSSSPRLSARLQVNDNLQSVSTGSLSSSSAPLPGVALSSHETDYSSIQSHEGDITLQPSVQASRPNTIASDSDRTLETRRATSSIHSRDSCSIVELALQEPVGSSSGTGISRLSETALYSVPADHDAPTRQTPEREAAITSDEDDINVKGRRPHTRLRKPGASSDLSENQVTTLPTKSVPMARKVTRLRSPFQLDKTDVQDQTKQPRTPPPPEMLGAIKMAYTSKLPRETFCTDVQDMVNRLPDEFQRRSDIRDLFEAVIVANTANDEPHAPKICIYNPVDEQPCPKLEFYYTNKLYHGENVPRPNFDLLEGCSCSGPCNPRNLNCACVKRQMKAIRSCAGFESFEGFMYNDKGHLQEFGLPIFECNMACRCSEECTNRVVQKGRKCHINIVKTKKKGWGIFAASRILKGTFIGLYSGELLGQEEALRRAQIYNQAGITYLFDIDFYYLHKRNRPARPNGSSPESLGNHYSPKRADFKEIKDADIDDTVYTVDAFHAGNFTRYLNHSCDPNCCICPVYVNEHDIFKPLIVIFAKRDIEVNQELCFSYFGDNNDDDESDGDEDAVNAYGASPQNDAVYAPCQCGAKKCRGTLFT